MIQTELFQGNQIYTVVLSKMLNSFPSMSLSIHSTVKQKIDKINSLLTCLRRVHFRGRAAGFLSCRWTFYRLELCVKQFQHLADNTVCGLNLFNIFQLYLGTNTILAPADPEGVRSNPSPCPCFNYHMKLK